MFAEQVADSIGTYRLVINEVAPTDCVIALHERWLGRIEFIKFHPRAVLVWLRADLGCTLVISAHLRHSWAADIPADDALYAEELGQISALID